MSEFNIKEVLNGILKIFDSMDEQIEKMNSLSNSSIQAMQQITNKNKINDKNVIDALSKYSEEDVNLLMETFLKLLSFQDMYKDMTPELEKRVKEHEIIVKEVRTNIRKVLDKK